MTKRWKVAENVRRGREITQREKLTQGSLEVRRTQKLVRAKSKSQSQRDHNRLLRAMELYGSYKIAKRSNDQAIVGVQSVLKVEEGVPKTIQNSEGVREARSSRSSEH